MDCFELCASPLPAVRRSILPINSAFHTSKKCKVVETKSADTTWVQVGPALFKTQADADKQIKAVCVEK